MLRRNYIHAHHRRLVGKKHLNISKLYRSEDAADLLPEAMKIDDLDTIQWLNPWERCPPWLEKEFVREMGPGHPLYNSKAISVGRRVDCDDVLFFIPDNAQPLAVVHLTWTGRPERSPEWPWATFFSSLDEWVEKCMWPDYRMICELADSAAVATPNPPDPASGELRSVSARWKHVVKLFGRLVQKLK